MLDRLYTSPFCLGNFMFANQRPRIILKSEKDLQGMRVAGQKAAECLAWLVSQVTPGMSTQDIDDLQRDFAKREGVKLAQLGYNGFPKGVCTSVNEVICHGIPSKDVVLKEGDIIGIDVTLIVDGYYGDTCSSVGVGKISDDAMRLLAVTAEATRLGIAACIPGNHLGDIGHAIQRVAEPRGFSVVRDFVGHGIGRRFHEEPQVLHYGKPGRGVRLRPGMVFTVEPMINEGVWQSKVLADGWTAVTRDGKLSAQFEHTLAVTEAGVEIMTCQNGKGEWEIPGLPTLDMSLLDR